MLPLPWLVLVAAPLVFSQPAPPNCCETKTVGGVSYTFVREDTTAISYSCLSPCVYERDDQPGTAFCFAQGDQQVVCGDDSAGTEGTWSRWGDWNSCYCGRKFRSRHCLTTSLGVPCLGYPDEMAECSLTEDPDQLTCQNSIDRGMMNVTEIPFFDYAFTYFDEPVTVTCCHQNNTMELATCGMGTSCEGSCSAIKASLCPSGDCADCAGLETNQTEDRFTAVTSLSSWHVKHCPGIACRVCTRNPICCLDPDCRKIRWIGAWCLANYLRYIN